MMVSVEDLEFIQLPVVSSNNSADMAQSAPVTVAASTKESGDTSPLVAVGHEHDDQDALRFENSGQLLISVVLAHVFLTTLLAPGSLLTGR